MVAPFPLYGIRAALVLLLLAPVAAGGARLPLLPALLLLPAAAFPVWLTLAYLAAIRRAHARALLQRPAWWAPLLGGTGLALVLALAPALLAACGVGHALLAGGWAAWGLLAATALLVHPAAAAVARPSRALRTFARTRPALLAAPVLVAALLTLALLPLAPGTPATLPQAVAAQPRYEGPSALLAALVDAAAVASGARALAEGWLPTPLAVLWRATAVFAQAVLIAGVFAACLLPPGEARRVLRPSDADDPPAPGPARVALAGALAAILALATLHLAARGEALAAARPLAATEAPALAGPGADASPTLAAAADPRPQNLPTLLAPTRARSLIEADRLGALLCPRGTVAAVRALDARLASRLGGLRDGVEREVAAAFGGMRANVPRYLDWHYSLGAEYARTGHLLLGDADAYLRGALGQRLGAGAPAAGLDRALAALGGASALRDAHRAERSRLLGPCEAALPADDAAVLVAAWAPAALLAAPVPVALDLEARLGAAGFSGAAGAVAGAVVGKAVAKVALTTGFKAAAAALAKVAAAKGAGALGGAAAGALAGGAAGSVVPVLGTGVGAALGGIVGGLSVGIAVDAALVELDEAISREAFEAEILAALDAAEAEMLAALRGP